MVVEGKLKGVGEVENGNGRAMGREGSARVLGRGGCLGEEEGEIRVGSREAVRD